ncbi:ribonuclease HI family protein [Granulicella paludicola]|uniref:ribonuclease HI family protein n=1 Tax=Granulicella paludicola TaxID=474951 RepID=UPI0021DF787A|nr:ribonuclease HI family protein [Granulicella paludicola]
MSSLFPDTADSSKNATSWVLAHCDGGARGNPGPAGFGAVVTDAAGHKLAEISEFLGHRTNNYAEYSGLLACLQWAIEHGHRRLRVVSDSELMVKQIQGKYKVNSPDLRPLWEEARKRITLLDGFEISHALRHKNKDADRLANEAMDRGTGRSPVPVSSGGGAARVREPAPETPSAAQAPKAPQMLRGFTRGGAIHLLGGAELPDGVFVKVIVE